MSTKSELIAETNLKCHLMSLKSVRDLMDKHPDADWDLVTRYDWDTCPARQYASLEGSIYIDLGCSSFANVGVDVDIRDMAYEIDVKHWICRKDIFKKTLKNGAQISLTMVVYQNLAEDEKQTLRDLGKLQTISYEPRSYDAVVCSR
jgi:hypothetical protein